MATELQEVDQKPRISGVLKPKLKPKLKWLFTLAAILIVYLVVESVSWSIYVGRKVSGEYIKDANVDIDHPYLPYLRSSAMDINHGTNRSGFRGQDVPLEKQENEIRILCVGASTTVDQHNFADSWPGLLEKKLSEAYPDKKIVVLTQATGSWFTSDNLVFYVLRSQDYHFDLVLIYDGWNDIVPSTTPGFKADYSHSRARPDSAFKVNPVLSKLKEFFPFIRYSPTFKLFEQLLFRKAVVSFNQHLYKGHGTPSNGIRGVEAFRRNIQTIATLASAEGAKVIYLSHIEQLHGNYLGDLESWLQHANHAANVRQAKEVVESTPNGYFFDLASQFPQRSELFSDRIHFMPEGSKIAGDLIADYLQSKKLVHQWNSHQSKRHVLFTLSDLDQYKAIGKLQPAYGEKLSLSGARRGERVYPAIYLRPDSESDHPSGFEVPLGDLPKGKYRLWFGIGLAEGQEQTGNVELIAQILQAENKTTEVVKKPGSDSQYKPGEIIFVRKYFNSNGGPASLRLLTRLSPEATPASPTVFFTYPILHLIESPKKAEKL